MSRVEFITANEAAKMIPDEASIGTCGFMMTGATEELFIEIEKRYLETGYPKNLSLMWASGIGDVGYVRGLNHFCHEGLIKKTIGGYYGLTKKLGPLVVANKIIAYNFPQGVLSHMFREMAAKKPGVLTHVGLGTFVDPDYEGGKLNSITTEALVQKLEINDKEFLFYPSQKIDYALIRGTEADEDGNIGFSKEALTLESLSAAMAAKNNGGIVIVQVERKLKSGKLNTKDVVIPGIFVDYVVEVQDINNHMQTAGTLFNEDFISNHRIYENSPSEFQLTDRKIIARRAAMQMTKDMSVINYGIGIPEGVAEILKEEGIAGNYTATVEPGVIGGIPLVGLNFGSALSPHAILDEPYQFDFYNGGGIDITFLGMAQCDEKANFNVSKFGDKVTGCGGFIDISQNAKEVIFCGTFTASGLKTKVENGKLLILQEGKSKKFIKKVEQITYNGLYERQKDPEKIVLLVTERAVFEIQEKGLVLTEIAPGIDLEKDILSQMDFIPIISDRLKFMDDRIFNEDLLGLKS
ncbi:CoA-transferase [Bacillaceae bacterium IKA-2]|nr:CoA-transferase [Bacillaceae bacterium IKA-2]